MFDFKIINAHNGAEIIDTRESISMDSLTPTQAIEYIEVDDILYSLERQERKRQKAVQKKRNNLLWKLASACGIL